MHILCIWYYSIYYILYGQLFISYWTWATSRVFLLMGIYHVTHVTCELKLSPDGLDRWLRLVQIRSCASTIYNCIQTKNSIHIALTRLSILIPMTNKLWVIGFESQACIISRAAQLPARIASFIAKFNSANSIWSIESLLGNLIIYSP